MGIWELNETEEELLDLYPANKEELSQLNSFHHSFRRKQFLASRLLLHTLLPNGKIIYDENGKPYLAKQNLLRNHISLSHTSCFIAIMMDRVHCGIDIEIIRPKIEKIASKFLCDQEMAEISGDHVTEKLHVYWCAKEAMYKVFGKKNVSLRRDIFVAPIKTIFSGTVDVTLSHEEKKIERKVNYELFRNCMLAWTEPTPE